MRNFTDKRILMGLLLALLPLTLSCSKDGLSQEVSALPEEAREIVVGLSGMSYDVHLSTRTTNVTAVPSYLYWGATCEGDEAGDESETAVWAAAAIDVTDGAVYTGKYQTPSPTTYNFYLCNVPFTVSANSFVLADNGTDVIVGRVRSSSTSPSVSLEHIFSRVGTLNLSVPGYTVTGTTTWSIIGKSYINGTEGVYSLRMGQWISSTATLSTKTAITSGCNLYLIPGVYTVSVTFTATKAGGSSRTITAMGDVTFTQGKVCNITATPDLVEKGWDDDWVVDDDETVLD